MTYLNQFHKEAVERNLYVKYQVMTYKSRIKIKLKTIEL